MPKRDVGWAGDPRAWTAVATVITGASGYLTLVVAARSLPLSEYGEFLAVWSILFGLFTVISGIGLETAASVNPEPPQAGRLRVLWLAAGVSVPSAALAAVVGGVISPRFGFPGSSLPAVFALAVGGYVVQTTLMGALAGMSRWRTYSIVISIEGIVRFLAVFLLAAVIGSVTSFVFAVAASTLSWMLLLLAPRIRSVWGEAMAGERPAVLLRRGTATSVGSIGPAILIVGYPALVKLLVPSHVFATSADTLLAVLLARAPFLLPLAVLQPAVVSRSRWGTDLLLRLVRVVLVGGLLGAILGATFGPAALVLFGEEYSVSSWLFALLAVDASLLAVMMLFSAWRLAQGRRRQYVLAWVSGVVVAIGSLVLPGSLDMRIAIGLLASPIAGTLVLLGSMRPRRSDWLL